MITDEMVEPLVILVIEIGKQAATDPKLENQAIAVALIARTMGADEHVVRQLQEAFHVAKMLGATFSVQNVIHTSGAKGKEPIGPSVN